MKKTVLSLVLFFFTAGFIYFSSENVSKTAPPTTPTVSYNQFIIGAMDCAWDYHYVNIPGLHLNTWHKYTDSPPIGDSVLGWLENDTWVHIQEDRYTNATTGYAGKITDRITLNTGTYGYQSLMDRPKTNYLADGQRSFYQCEPSTSLTSEFQDYSFYTYNTHNTGTPELDNTQFGNGVEVMHCRTLPVDNFQDSAGYVVKDLKTNREQTSAGTGYNFKQRDDIGSWYVKPRIRIPTGLPDNTQVCKIEILDWNGQPVQAFPNGKVILAGNFRNVNNSYDGRYLDEFFPDPNSSDPAVPIVIPEGQLTPGNSPGDWKDWTNSNFLTDFRVHWYGACDMWIDYVCVENEPAHELFDPADYHQWEQQIRNETDLALTGAGGRGYIPNNFYLEEFEFNNTACIGRVNQIIQDEASQHGVDISLMMNLNYALFKVHVPGAYDMTSAQLKRFLVDSAKAKTIVNVSYVMEGWPDSPPYASQRSLHPPTLYTGTYQPTAGVLSYLATSTGAYDDWLQTSSMKPLCRIGPTGYGPPEPIQFQNSQKYLS